MNTVCEKSVLLAMAYTAPKVGSWLKTRQTAAEGTSLFDYGTYFCREMDSKAIDYLGMKKWRYLVNVYGDNLWIGLLGVYILLNNQDRTIFHRDKDDSNLNTVMIGLTIFPVFAYGLRVTVYKFLPGLAQVVADFVKPKE